MTRPAQARPIVGRSYRLSLSKKAVCRCIKRASTSREVAKFDLKVADTMKALESIDMD